MARVIRIGSEGVAGKSGKFDLLDQEMLAAQLVAIMDAHFERPDTEQKLRILDLARQQVSL
jgi:hypothetical protein